MSEIGNMERVRSAVGSLSSAIGYVFGLGVNELQLEASQTDNLTRLLERGKQALENGDTDLANRSALQAMLGAREAKDTYLRLRERSHFTNQQLADWFGTCAVIFNQTETFMNAARCFYTATVFDNKWTEMEHVRVGRILWENIFTVKSDEFSLDIRKLIAFLHELDEIAGLAEQLERWNVSIQISLDVHAICANYRSKEGQLMRTKILRETLMRMARCGLGLRNHNIVRKACHDVLTKFCDYDHPEAFEVWGRSLICEKEYPTAKKKIELALNYTKNGTDKERLEQLLSEINKHIKPREETVGPDPGWLAGTAVYIHKKVKTLDTGKTDRQKKRHRRPKAKERGAQQNDEKIPKIEQPTELYSRKGAMQKLESASPGSETQVIETVSADITTPKQNHKESRIRHESERSDVTSVSYGHYNISDFDSDSDSSENSVSMTSDISVASSTFTLPEIEETTEDNTQTFYELSCRFHGDQGNEDNLNSPQDIKLLREGLQLNASFVHKVKCEQSKAKDKSFYGEMMTQTECEHRLTRQPKQFQRCSLQIEGSHLSYCTPMKSDGKISQVEISGRSKAGRTFNEDEVVVEILDVEHEDQDKRYGKVVGVINRERHKDVKHPVFICTLDDMESHLLRPMCKTVPKIHVLHDEIIKRFYNQRKNKIELYRYNHRNGTLEFTNIIDINPADRDKYVFMVAYLQWERKQYSIYPVGAVIRVLPCGDTISRGLRILDLQHEVPSVYSAACVQRLESIRRRQSDEPPESLTCDRQDLTHLLTFTIDPAGSKDIDDALSIEQLEEGFRVGVHISDVSVYVQKGDDIDTEAKERATTFYPGIAKPRHMLPEPLSQNICSLLPMKKRLCISIFHDLDREGGHKNTEIRLTVIESKHQLTYDEAQGVIESKISESCPHTELYTPIKQLHMLAEKRRKKRLGNAMFALDLETDRFGEDATEETLEAHYLVEEFMILTNWKVANFLTRSFPEVVPLRCQSPPDKENLDSFMKNESVILNLVLKLHDKRIYPTPSLEAVPRSRTDNKILIPKWLWDLINHAPEKALRFMKMDELFPQQYLAYQHWLSIQEHALYRCSGSLKREKSDGKHFSLDYTTYTHFTSPIRRYIDILVHRLVHCSLKKKSSPYNTSEVERICLHVNSVAKKAKAYKKGCKCLEMSVRLRSNPQMKVCFVDEISDKGVSLCARDIRYASKTNRELQFNLLDMGFKPEESTDALTGKPSIVTKWRKRVYDFTGVPTVSAGSSRDALLLNQYPGMALLPAWEWAKLLKSGFDCRWRDFKKTVDTCNYILPDRGLDDINTEVYDITKIQPSTTFSLSFTRGQCVKIQLSSEPQKGLLSLKPQLFDVTKSFKCCLQHTDDPVMHLTYYSTRSTLDRYSSVRQYLDRWLPLISMEAAVGSVSNEDTCTINNVQVKFRGRSGKFILPLSFCGTRNIEFGGTTDEDEEDDSRTKSYDFLCLKHMTQATESDNLENRRQSFQHCWIGHGEITKVCRKKDVETSAKVRQRNGQTIMERVKKETGDGILIVSFDLHRLAPDPPIEMAVNGVLTCGVEILVKSEVDRRTEGFIKKLPEEDSSLAQSIALNKPIPELDQEHIDFFDLMDRDLVIPEGGQHKPLPRNNLKQQEAIDKALGSRFSLIQGPPGTGKTYTGIKLLYLFNQINKNLHREGSKRKQVLFCGPSNKSVDLVARWMVNRLGNLCPNIVRVYGRSIEAYDFPIPGKSFLSRRSTHNAKADEELRSVALHHLIRQKGKPFAEEIKKYDTMFKKSNYQADPVNVKAYLKFLRDASIAELKEHDVILCTTAVGSNPKIQEGTDIFQVIIDESGMCPEPHCLVPVIANKAEQVVLIGDHKQLRPIIMCKEAAELGLEKSLFEKYWESNSARSVQKTMLDIQYRMNPQLCRFPSNAFYEGKLKTESGLWKDGRVLKIWSKQGTKFYPHVLVHIEGEEKVLTVSTEDGNEQSKSNQAEIEQVIKVFRYLINDEQIPANQVNVISQYNAQCSEIRRQLDAEGFVNYKVNTVVSSQGGEWDYVVFSTVRSLPVYKIEEHPTQGWCKQNLGFITDQNQINVALTRARKGLIIIGNKNLLRCDQVWGKLVNQYEESDCIKSPEEFPPKRTRQERMRIATQMSVQRYGDERFTPGNLPQELGPYMAASGDTGENRSGRYNTQRMNSYPGSRWQRGNVDEAGDGWQQQRRGHRGRH